YRGDCRGRAAGRFGSTCGGGVVSTAFAIAAARDDGGGRHVASGRIGGDGGGRRDSRSGSDAGDLQREDDESRGYGIIVESEFVSLAARTICGTRAGTCDRGYLRRDFICRHRADAG